MFQHKPRRFRYRSNGRDHKSHNNGHAQARLRSNSFLNHQTRNNFRTTQSAEKLLEKYNTLAKEAKSSGDETSYENYLQHADHFTRIIEDKNKNKNKNQSKVDGINKSVVDSKLSPGSSDIKQEDLTKNKE